MDAISWSVNNVAAAAGVADDTFPRVLMALVTIQFLFFFFSTNDDDITARALVCLRGPLYLSICCLGANWMFVCVYGDVCRTRVQGQTLVTRSPMRCLIRLAGAHTDKESRGVRTAVSRTFFPDFSALRQ